MPPPSKRRLYRPRARRNGEAPREEPLDSGSVTYARSTLILLALHVLVPAAAGAASTLIVQVRTDMRPGVDFTQIRTRLLTTHGGNLIQERTRSARAGEDWARGIRVAEIGPLGEGPYRALVSALDRNGRVVVERPARLELTGGVRVLTVLLTVPPAPAVDECAAQFSRDKRECGLALKKCLEDGTRLASCQETHDACIAGAAARRDKCATKAPSQQRLLPRGDR